MSLTHLKYFHLQHDNTNLMFPDETGLMSTTFYVSADNFRSEFTFKMSSRLHRIGTIYSRIDGLIRKNHLKEIDRPLWFDVYKKFPPKYEPTYTRKEPEASVRNILYPEDILRAKIHKAFSKKIGVYDLKSRKNSFSQVLLKTCQRYISEGLSEDEAIEKLKTISNTDATSYVT